ncbi:MAG: hypothetical protein AB1345_12900 [Chloroflexota bacterium]
MQHQKLSETKSQPSDGRLHFLDEKQIEMIDEALTSLGNFGEVRLVVERGRIRFVVTQKSFDALKWQPKSSFLEVP